jgi:hypothetical protein
MFGFQHKKRSWGFGFFFSFSNKYEKKSHNMFFLLLDPRFKTLYLVFSLIGHEQGKAIVEKYDSF